MAHKATFAERLAAGLQATGYTELEPRSGYRVFRGTVGSPLLVGKNGALRVLPGRAIAGSYSIGEPSRQGKRYMEVLAAGDKALSLTPAGAVDVDALLKGLES